MTVEFLTPVGRVVQGHPLDKQDKNMQGQPLMTQSGQPTQRFFVALAFQKTDASFGQLFGLMQQVAQASFPGMTLLPPSDPRCRFSWKIADGDGMDDNGKPNANKPGFAGCWVVKFQSSYMPKCYYAGKYRPEDQITDPKFIKRGWYARIAGTIEGNGQANKPGLYMNLSLFELCGGTQADEIVSGPDASSVFGASAAVLPAGVGALALGPVATTLPGMVPTQPVAVLPAGTAFSHPVTLGVPMVPAAVLPQSAAPLPLSAPTVMPVAALAPAVSGATTSPSNPVAVQPNPAFLLGPLAPIAPAVPQLTPQALAAGFTLEKLRAAGHTDDAALRAAGYLV